MALAFRLVIRALVIVVGYVVAVLVGWLAFVLMDWAKVNGLAALLLLTSANAMEQVARIVLRFGLGTAVGFALIPCALFIIAAEWLRLRSLLIQAYAGGIMGLWLQLRFTNADLSVWREFDWDTWIDLGTRSAAGVVAGLVYWAIAGRSAGKWRALSASPALDQKPGI